MPLIRPFAGLRPAPGRAAEVLAPPYDVLSSAEARARATGRPWSFLHISKPEIDLSPDTDPYDASVYAQGRANFARMRSAGVLMRDPQPHYYAYQLTMGAHTQTGLVAAASVAAYDGNRIRRHELTRPDKEDDRVRQIEALNAQTGPVFLTYRHAPPIDEMTAAITAPAPEVEVTADDGVRHRLWVVRDAATIAALGRAFDAMPALYIADGHHRSAAASRVAADRRARAAYGGEEAHEYFLAVIFPDDQVRILGYHRAVKDLNGLSREEFLARLAGAFTVEPAAGALEPRSTGEFGLYLPGQWYRLRIAPARVPAAARERLDVSLLQNHVVDPILGIRDPRRDRRIDFIGGIRGLGELERRVDSGEMACAFALHPTTVAEMMAVADAGEVMPPKSTWFEPKLADGMVSHLLD